MTNHESRPGRPPKESLTPLGQRVRDIRTAKGWTVEELAAASGCDPNTVYNVERARHEPRIYTVYRVAQALGCSLDYLVTGTRS